MTLTIQSIRFESYHVIELSGDVDTKTAPALLDTLTEIELASTAELRIQMKEVNFMSSAGLRALVFAKQKMPHESRLILIGTSEEIADIIIKTGLAQAMTMVANHDEIA